MRQPGPLRSAMVLLALGIGIAACGTGSPPTVPASAPPEPSRGLRTFEAPGIRFDYPVGWTDQTGVVESHAAPGTRFVALLADGLSICPVSYGSTASPPPEPASCQTHATVPGSLVLSMIEHTNQLPGGVHGSETETTVAGYPAWEAPLPSELPDPASMSWAIQAPDGGLYLVWAEAPRAELVARRADVQALLASLRLSAWEAPQQVVNGHVHLDLPQGFSFAYPAEWIVYYPQARSTRSSAVVTVASLPLEPPCATDLCQRFTTPPGTVAVEFRVGNGPVAPNWSDAPTTIAGQPAFREDWGPQNATGAEEGHSWSVRLHDPAVLSIHVSLRGPDLPGLRTAMDEVLGSIRITPQQ